MFCAYCGESISVRSKFCSYCGKATFIGNPGIKYHTSNSSSSLDFNHFYEGNERTIAVGDKNIIITREQDCFNVYRRAFRENAAEIMSMIIPQFHEKLKDVVDIFKGLNVFMFEAFNPIFTKIALTLEAQGVRGLEVNNLERVFYDSKEFLYQKDLNDLLDRYNAILAKKHRAVNIAASLLPDGYIVGSIEGYIASTALSLGAGTIIDSQLNSTDISYTDKKRLYETCDYELWFDHMYVDLKNVVYYFFQLLQEAKIIDYSPVVFIKNNRAEVVFNSIKDKKLSINEWTEQFYEIISCNPYEERYFRVYRDVLDKMGTNELKEQFNKMIEYFVIDEVREFSINGR